MDARTLPRVPRWLGWAGLTVVAWGIWGVLFKLLGSGLSAEKSQALSTIGFLPVLVPLLWNQWKEVRSASRKGLLLAIAGGVVSCLGNIPYYAAIGRGEKFATVISLVAMAPVVTVLLALILLKERLTRPQYVGMILATVAIWLFNVTEDKSFLSSTVAVAVAPIVLWGLAGFLQKVSTNFISGEVSAVAFLGAFLPMGVFYGWSETWPSEISGKVWLISVALGLFLAFGNYTVILAYARSGKAAVIAPLVNLFPVISIGLAVLFLNESVGKREVAAIACALTAAALLSVEGPPAG